jgi:hypothetical protein
VIGLADYFRQAPSTPALPAGWGAVLLIGHAAVQSSRWLPPMISPIPGASTSIAATVRPSSFTDNKTRQLLTADHVERFPGESQGPPFRGGATEIWVPAFPTELIRGLKAHRTAALVRFHPGRVGRSPLGNSQVEGLDGLRVVRHDDRLFRVSLGQIALVLRLQVDAPFRARRQVPPLIRSLSGETTMADAGRLREMRR